MTKFENETTNRLIVLCNVVSEIQAKLNEPDYRLMYDNLLVKYNELSREITQANLRYEEPPINDIYKTDYVPF
jgi:flagellin-specific chaperone FliS